jgi:hypothetical protein
MNQDHKTEVGRREARSRYEPKSGKPRPIRSTRPVSIRRSDISASTPRRLSRPEPLQSPLTRCPTPAPPSSAVPTGGWRAYRQSALHLVLPAISAGPRQTQAAGRVDDVAGLGSPRLHGLNIPPASGS